MNFHELKCSLSNFMDQVDTNLKLQKLEVPLPKFNKLSHVI